MTRPGFDVIPMLSTRPQWFTYVRLSLPYLTRSVVVPFPVTLTTRALDPSRSRWFAACLRRPAARDLPSSHVHIAWRTIIGKADQEASALQAWLDLLLKPFIEDLMEIGSKDGALPPCGGTSPPSALRTGRATRRCTQLAGNLLTCTTGASHAILLDDAVDGMRDRAV
jgi:hypothetical protein